MHDDLDRIRGHVPGGVRGHYVDGRRTKCEHAAARQRVRHDGRRCILGRSLAVQDLRPGRGGRLEGLDPECVQHRGGRVDVHVQDAGERTAGAVYHRPRSDGVQAVDEVEAQGNLNSCDAAGAGNSRTEGGRALDQLDCDVHTRGHFERGSAEPRKVVRVRDACVVRGDQIWSRHGQDRGSTVRGRVRSLVDPEVEVIRCPALQAVRNGAPHTHGPCVVCCRYEPLNEPRQQKVGRRKLE